MAILVLFVVIGSSIWVLIDAKSIGVKKGQIKGMTDMGPLGWFFVVLGLWIIGFPAYLLKREEYKRLNNIAQSNADVAGPGTTSHDKLICQVCKSEVDADAAFCDQCGNALSKNQNHALNNNRPILASSLTKKEIIVAMIAVVVAVLLLYAYTLSSKRQPASTSNSQDQAQVRLGEHRASLRNYLDKHVSLMWHGKLVGAYSIKFTPQDTIYDYDLDVFGMSVNEAEGYLSNVCGDNWISTHVLLTNGTVASKNSINECIERRYNKIGGVEIIVYNKSDFNRFGP